MNDSSQNHEPEKEQLAEGTLMSHLVELRSRIMKAMLAIVVVFVCLAPFISAFSSIVSAPLRELCCPARCSRRPRRRRSSCRSKPRFSSRCFIAMPVVLFQAWQFVAPGLYRQRETPGHSAHDLEHRSVLRRAWPSRTSSCSAVFTFFAQDDTRRRDDDDGHRCVSRLRSDDFPRSSGSLSRCRLPPSC